MRFWRIKNMLVKPQKTQFVFKITASCVLFILAVFLLSPLNVVHASTPVGDEIIESTDVVGQEAGLQKENPRIIVGRIIKVFLGLLGAIALSIVIYAGFIYMTSGGDPGKVEKAKKWLINGVIGLVIIFAAYSIVTFIINAILGTLDGEGEYEITSTLPKGLGYGLSGNAFGKILSGTSPYPEQTDVPRNTMILVSFKLPIDAQSLINTNGDYSVCPGSISQCTDGNCPEDESVCGPVNVGNFKLFRCDDMPDWPENQAPHQCLNAVINEPADDLAVQGYIIVTADRKTVIFNPNGDTANHLGSSEENVSYIAQLGSGPAGIKKFENTDESVFTEDYRWRFTTGTFIDTTPPQIKSVVPKDGAGIDEAVNDITLDNQGKVKRNTIILVNFNEPVIPPLSASQTLPCENGYNNNEAQILVNGDAVQGCQTGHVPGEWTVGINQYKTIQFIPSAQCEGVSINSCGEPVFCLPADRNLDGKILAAEIVEGIAQIGTGIMDLASNSLDGDKDGKADGPDADNYEWSFGVGNTVDLEPPSITALSPKNAEGNIDPWVAIRATFDKPLEPATVDSQIYLYGEDYSSWFDPNTELVDEDDPDFMKIVKMNHGPFYAPPQQEGQVVEGPKYMPVVRSKVRDLFQNCFTPSRSTNNDGTSQEPAGAPTCFDVSGSSDNYGDSCCPNNATYAPTRVTAEVAVQSGNDFNECNIDGITR